MPLQRSEVSEMKEIRVNVDLQHTEFVIEVEEDADAKHIGALAWSAAINVLNVSWREGK